MSGPLQNGFQGVVYNQPAPAEAGDFIGVNPRASVISADGQLVSPSGGLIVGNFAYVAADGTVTQAPGSGGQVGFLHRENNAIIIDFLAPATYLVQAGFPITLFSQGDFWAKFAAGAAPGQPVYANNTTGAPQVASSGGTLTPWIVNSVAANGELAKISTWG